ISPDESGGYFSKEAEGRYFSAVYRAYDDFLHKSNALDFDSLLYFTVYLFRKYPKLANQYRKTYRYWNVDEFQDTNDAQYSILRIMAGSGFRNLFFVADDDQIIYQWNGASHERIEQFINDYQPNVV